MEEYMLLYFFGTKKMPEVVNVERRHFFRADDDESAKKKLKKIRSELREKHVTTVIKISGMFRFIPL